MNTLRWVDVGAPEDLKFAPGAPVRIGESWYAIFRLGEEFSCIDNACPHAGAPLCDGTLLDGKIVCFLHHWEFDVRTGRSDVGPQWNVAAHPVKLVDGRLHVGIAVPTAT
jgi:nitrite reductase/ring-hydroxylating ferredoxin subunit